MEIKHILFLQLTVASKGSSYKQWIKLPKRYTREELPVDGKEAATKEKIAKWQYLQMISRMMCHEGDVSVVVLIGSNCSKTTELVEVIPKPKGRTVYLKNSSMMVHYWFSWQC